MSSPAVRQALLARSPIWLVRHAPTEWTGQRWCGRSDPALTEAGRAAAHRLAIEIATEIGAKDPAGVVVLSSPLRRALDTARAIAELLGASTHVEPDLVEVDFGAADGLTWEQLCAAHPSLAAAILAGTSPDWPGGETADEVAARARSAADRILDLAAMNSVVVVSHGGLLAALLLHLGGAVAPGRLAAGSALRIDPLGIE